MQELLSQHPMMKLLWAAGILSAQFNVEGVNRSGRRNRDALICWFCESFLNLLSDPAFLFNILA
jgi:hypothetical protein